MVRATKAQLSYLNNLITLGPEPVDKYSLTISTANSYIKRNRILLDMDVIGDLRPEALDIPNH